MALPAIDALTDAWQGATFSAYVGRHSRAAFEFRPALSLLPIPNSIDLQSALLLARSLRQQEYDAVIVLDRSRWLRLAARLSRAPVTGSARSMSPELRHESDVYLDIVRELGVRTPRSTPSIQPSPDAERLASELLFDVSSPFAVLQTGGARNPGVNMLDKRWPKRRIIQLATKLERDGVAVVLSGGPGDVEITTQVANQASIPASRILAGRADLGTLAAVLRRAAVYVGPDTGVSHVAAAVGVPTIAIFGPTNPRRYRPLGSQVQVLAPPESWTIPDRDLRQPSATATKASTESISVAQVVAAVHRAVNLAHGIHQCDG
ncbi:MAG: glycosyltransferase family 9 protein [Thermomicrobiales bacterium]